MVMMEEVKETPSLGILLTHYLLSRVFGIDEGSYEMWNTWDLDSALYDCIRDYYTTNLGEDGVVLHEQNAGVLSDHGEDD